MAGKTAEERIAAIDEKIAFSTSRQFMAFCARSTDFFSGIKVRSRKQAEIDVLEAQKQKLLHPVNMKTVMAAAKEAGLTNWHSRGNPSRATKTPHRN